MNKGTESYMELSIHNDRVPVEPQKCLCIHALDGYETYKIDENTIGVRPIWISVLELDKLPESFQEILFTDGHEVFKGYRLESLDKDLDMWFSGGDHNINGVTHWMSLPYPPKNE